MLTSLNKISYAHSTATISSLGISHISGILLIVLFEFGERLSDQYEKMTPFIDEKLDSDDSSYQVPGEYIIPESLLGTRRPIKVIVIGFGFSGIHLSYILGKQTKNSNITLQFYEKNPGLGGTWFENS